MKKLLFIPLLLIGFKAVAQDTTWVQTFTFDSIVTRRANFQFPASLDTMRFEKVLMYYKLKCSPLTTWDQYNCGEWDYLTYTRIFNHTGIMDSIRVDGPNFRVNTLAPVSYAYANQAFYDQQWKAVNRRTPAIPIQHALTGTAGTPITFVSDGANGGKMQWIIPASKLATSGVVAGDIQGMELSFLNSLAQLQGVQIRIKSTNLSSLSAFETSGFTTVFDDQWNALTIGNTPVHFSAPFAYDGTSNLIIELSYTDARLGLTELATSTLQAEGTENTLIYSNENGVFRTTASNFAEINLSNVDLGGDVTIAFWSKGNGSYGTNTSILEAVDSLNNRIFNIHMPWSDNTIYFDAGEGSGYDRISKSATNNDSETWHHWAFVKKTSTGQMFIYKDGVLWHQGTGLNRPIGKVARFFLGSNWDQQYQYKGDIDEFSVWTSALDAATISTWKNKKIDASHPNYSNLEVYYDFDGQTAMIDRSGNSRLGMCSDLAMIQHNVEPVAGLTSVATIPNLVFTQGTSNAVTVDSVLEAQFPATSVLFQYTPSDNSFHISGNALTYSQGTVDTLSISGMNLGSVPSLVEATLVKDTITYFQPPFEYINEVEIGRYITPYGIGFDLGPQGFTWIYDVTDYQKYLHGMVDLGAHNTQELLDLKFAFIEGIPARDVHNVEPIWGNYRSYSYGDMDNDVVLQEVAVPLSDTSEMFKIKTRFTGHGHNGTTNCCEWDPKDHQIIVDGIPRFTWDIWQETECGENPNIKQGGTWPYAREGWCPGDMVKEYDHDLTPYVQPGDTVLLDYDIEDVPVNDQAQANGNYIVAMDLVSYSAPNFQHDAAIVDVLNPNSYEYYSKWNPTCSNPRIILQNNGEQPLTSCRIRVWVTYGNWQEYQWTGNLAFLEKEMVEIPIADNSWWFFANPNDQFHAQVYAVNGAPDMDEYAPNNLKKVKYTAPEFIGGPFFAWFVTNNKANENKWKLIDGNGNTIFERTSLSNSTDYKDTFDLAPGCYSIILEDSDHDGISFWYSSQVEGETSGSFRIRKVGGSIIETFPGDFGKYHRYDFSVGFGVGMNENESADEFLVFPNPSTDKIRIEYVGNLGKELQVQILDMNGRVVKNSTMLNNNNSYAEELFVNDMQAGYYLIRVVGENGSRTTSFVKQ